MQNYRPIDTFKKYFLDVKPYHTKILEILEKYNLVEDVRISFAENLFFNVDYKNNPLCRPTGFGIIWDGECGFDALDCCDIFNCVGGYGVIFDNSELVAEHHIMSVDYDMDTFTVSGDATRDARLQINTIPSEYNIRITGNVENILKVNDHTHSVVAILPVKNLPIVTSTENTVTVSGDHVDIFTPNQDLLLYNTSDSNGMYRIKYSDYYSVGNTTLITLVRRVHGEEIIESDLTGMVEVRTPSRNNGIYLIDSVQYDGTMATDITLHSSTPLPYTNSTEGRNHGSIQLRTALIPDRTVYVEQTATSLDNGYRVIRSDYDIMADTTTVFVSADIDLDTVLYPDFEINDNGLLRMYGYTSEAGYDGRATCETPKHSNIAVGFAEKLVIYYDDSQVTPTPSPTATLTPTPTVTPTQTPTQTPTMTPTPSIPQIVAFHEWKLGEDFGNVVYDTGTSNLVSDITLNSIARNTNAYVGDLVDDNVTTSLQVGSSTSSSASANVYYPVAANWTNEIWMHPLDNTWNSTLLYIGLSMSWDKVSHNIKMREDTSVASSVGSIPPYKWTHVVITCTTNGTNKDIVWYIDGVVDTTMSLVFNPNTYYNSFGADWNGLLNHARVYDSALSAGDVSRIYTNYYMPFVNDVVTNNETTLSLAPDIQISGISDNSGDFGCWGVAAKPDGTEFYSLYSDGIQVFSCDTPWNIQTATASGSPSLLHVTTENNGRSVTFNNDGTKMYSGYTYTTEYELSAPYVLSTATPTGKTKNVDLLEPGTTYPYCHRWSTDGLHFYIADDAANYIEHYATAIPWDVTGLYLSGQDLYTGSQDSGPRGIVFKPDGTKLYVSGNTNNRIYSYTMATPWNLDTATYDTIYVSAIDSTPGGMWMSDDGLMLFISGLSSYRVNRLDLSVAWDLSTAVNNGHFFYFGLSSVYDVALSTDGTKMFIARSNSDVYSYTLATPFDLTTAALTTDGPDLSTLAISTKRALYTKPDGTEFYISEASTASAPSVNIHQYTLATPWTWRTATYTGVGNTGVEDVSTEGFYIKPDGTKVYTAGFTNNKIYQYSLGTPWDISTLSYDSISLDGPTLTTGPVQYLSFKDDGTILYVSCGKNAPGIADTSLVQYDLATPWDLSTATSHEENFHGWTQMYEPASFTFSSDGSKIYLPSYGWIYEFTLSTPWEIKSSHKKLHMFREELIETMGVSSDGENVCTYVRDRTDLTGLGYRLIVWRKNGSSWDYYGEMENPPNTGADYTLLPFGFGSHSRITNNGQYIFISTLTGFIVLEDQLDGTYAQIQDVIANEWHLVGSGMSLPHLTTSTDGTVVAMAWDNEYGVWGTEIYRKSGSTWSFEQKVGDYSTGRVKVGSHAILTEDGSRLICSNGVRNINAYTTTIPAEVHAIQVYKYNSGNTTWEYENSLPLDGIQDLLGTDRYNSPDDLVIGYNTLIIQNNSDSGLLSANEDGSVISVNYHLPASMRNTEATSTLASGIMVYKESLGGGTWDWIQNLRDQNRRIGKGLADETNQNDIRADISGDGNRIVVSSPNSEFSTAYGGDHGRLYVFDYNQTSNKYEHVKVLESLMVHRQDLFGAKTVIDYDGSTVFALHPEVQTSTHLSGNPWGFESRPTTTRDGGIVVFSLGAYGTLPPIEFKSEQFEGETIDTLFPYLPVPDYMPKVSYLNKPTSTASRGYTSPYGHLIISDFSTDGNTEAEFSVKSNVSGKKYMEFAWGGGSHTLVGINPHASNGYPSTTTQYTYETFGRLIYEGNVISGEPVAPPYSIIGMAIDFDNQKLWFSINNEWIGGGDPSTGTTPTITMTVPGVPQHFICGYQAGHAVYGPSTTKFQITSDELTYDLPTGYTLWDETPQGTDWGYEQVIKFDNPIAYWNFGTGSLANRVTSDLIGTNDISFGGVYGYIDDWAGNKGAFATRYADGYLSYGTLDTEITFTAADPFTVSFWIYVLPDPDVDYRGTILMSSENAVDNSTFEMYYQGQSSTTVHLGFESVYNEITPVETIYTSAVNYETWTHIGFRAEADGTVDVYVNGTRKGAVNLDASALFGLKYIGGSPTTEVMHGLITELAVYDTSLDTPAYNYSVNDSVELDQHWYAGTGLSTYSWFVPPGPPAMVVIGSDYDTLTFTAYKSKVTPSPLHILTNHVDLTLTPYKSKAGPPETEVIHGPYLFDTQAAPENSDFIWTGPSGTSTVIGSSNGNYRWEDYTTGSSNTGPTSGVGGTPGYVYPETSGTSLGNTFNVEFAAPLVAVNGNIVVDFYTNQYGSGNNMTLQLQTNTDGAGWVDQGPLLGGPTDPDKVTSLPDVWVARHIEISGIFGASHKLRWFMQMPASGTTYQNDYALDSITITDFE
jgi:sugar lactone lactonase YvrE